VQKRQKANFYVTPLSCEQDQLTPLFSREMGAKLGIIFEEVWPDQKVPSNQNYSKI